MPSYKGWICHHGLLITSGAINGQFPGWAKGEIDAKKAKSNGAALISGAKTDFICVEEDNSPSFAAIEINGLDSEILELISQPVEHDAFAVTHYGPDSQEKACNQDFALAMTLKDSDNNLFSCGVVADGVSTGTFWPERASRIACFSAMKAMKAFLNQPPATKRSGERFTFAEKLRETLLADFEADRGILQREDRAPPGWEPNFYRSKSPNKIDSWYKTTVLAAALGHEDGFILWSGDGGVVEFPNDQAARPNILLQTDDSVLIREFASLAMRNEDLVEARFLPLEQGRRIMFSSDGIDRSAQGVDKKLYVDVDNLLRAGNAAAVLDRVEQLSRKDSAAKDNMSLVWLRAPRHHGGTALRPGHALWVASPPRAGAPAPPPARSPDAPTPPPEPPSERHPPSPPPLPPIDRKPRPFDGIARLPWKSALVGVVVVALIGAALFYARGRLKPDEAETPNASDITQQGGAVSPASTPTAESNDANSDGQPTPDPTLSPQTPGASAAPSTQAQRPQARQRGNGDASTEEQSVLPDSNQSADPQTTEARPDDVNERPDNQTQPESNR